MPGITEDEDWIGKADMPGASQRRSRDWQSRRPEGTKLLLLAGGGGQERINHN